MTSPSKKPIGILIIAWILVIVGGVGILGAIPGMAVSRRLAFGMAIPSVITIALGLALRQFRRGAFIAVFAYLGLLTVTGIFSGHWLAASVAILLLLYLWKVRDAFESSADRGGSLSITDYGIGKKE